MEPNNERPAEVDLDAAREALVRIRRECNRLLAEQNFSSPTPAATQRLFDQLLDLREELGTLSRLRERNDIAEHVTQDLIVGIRFLNLHLHHAHMYAESAGQPLEAVTASTSDRDVAIQEALPQIREQCNQLIAQQDFTLPEHERVYRLIDEFLGLTEEFQELTGLEFDDDGLLVPAFEEQAALQSIDRALHGPILQVQFLLRDAWNYATSASRLLEADLADTVGGPFLINLEAARDVGHIDEAQVVQTVAGMKRTNSQTIENANKAAAPDESEYPDACAICLEVWASGDDIVQLPCHFTHVLHEECAREVLLSRAGPSVPKCPLCRRPIPLE